MRKCRMHCATALAAAGFTLSANAQNTAGIDDARLENAIAHGEWLTRGGDYAETHYSPLTTRSTWAIWIPAATGEELAEFCERMSEMRRAIWESKGIRAALVRCPKCGAQSRSDGGDVSIRSALFALRKSGVVSEADFKALEKNYRKMRGLDAYGRNVEQGVPGDAPSTCC